MNEPLYFLILLTVLFKKSIPSGFFGSMIRCASSHIKITLSFRFLLISYQHHERILKNCVLRIVSSESIKLCISKTIKSASLSTFIDDIPLNILASAPIVARLINEQTFSNDSITFFASFSFFAVSSFFLNFLYKSSIIG